MEKMSSSIEPVVPRTANLLACKQWWRVCFLYGDQQKYYRQVYSKAAAQRLVLSANTTTIATKLATGDSETTTTAATTERTTSANTFNDNHGGRSAMSTSLRILANDQMRSNGGTMASTSVSHNDMNNGLGDHDHDNDIENDMNNDNYIGETIFPLNNNNNSNSSNNNNNNNDYNNGQNNGLNNDNSWPTYPPSIGNLTSFYQSALGTLPNQRALPTYDNVYDAVADDLIVSQLERDEYDMECMNQIIGEMFNNNNYINNNHDNNNYINKNSNNIINSINKPNVDNVLNLDNCNKSNYPNSNNNYNNGNINNYTVNNSGSNSNDNMADNNHHNNDHNCNNYNNNANNINTDSHNINNNSNTVNNCSHNVNSSVSTVTNPPQPQANEVLSLNQQKSSSSGWLTLFPSKASCLEAQLPMIQQNRLHQFNLLANSNALRKSKRFMKSLRGQRKPCNSINLNSNLKVNGKLELNSSRNKMKTRIEQDFALEKVSKERLQTFPREAIKQNARQTLLNDPFLFGVGIDADHLGDLVRGNQNPYLNAQPPSSMGRMLPLKPILPPKSRINPKAFSSSSSILKRNTSNSRQLLRTMKCLSLRDPHDISFTFQEVNEDEAAQSSDQKQQQQQEQTVNNTITATTTTTNNLNKEQPL